MPSPTVDYILGDMLMHSHNAGDLSNLVTVATLATILATTPTVTTLAYATDTSEFLLYDGTNWKVMPIELETEAAAPDIGAHEVVGLGKSDKAGYYKDAITDKSLSNIRILGNVRTEEGAIRTTASGIFQVYLNGVWNTVVINFVFREDSTGKYELEHIPVGFSWYYEIMSGNSNEVGLDGYPIIQQYTANMGVYGPLLIIDGGVF